MAGDYFYLPHPVELPQTDETRNSWSNKLIDIFRKFL